ncbi:hypothetical protein ABIE65_004871 [Constrictibacter sp. MBR-5]|jgi:hypothetical protein|uniref:hypothetical protein n=1 Tax=Constrictibacter sp. MBR-5 TaxID=3156467 RepID=UPI0033969959
MDWFERLAGFVEGGYAQTQSCLAVQDTELQSLVNGRKFGIGTLQLVSLKDLRDQVHAGPRSQGRLTVQNVTGDVRHMHQDPQYAGALFQVASQFNLLEMASPDVTPEDGVTRYAFDRTQGPACAIAAGAATLYRNYFVPNGGSDGQTSERQLDGLADVGAAIAQLSSRPMPELWTMRNGYALCSAEGLSAISACLQAAGDAEIDRLRSLLRVGLHSDVEVTDGELRGRLVSQVFCSALPVAYTDVAAGRWQPFATLVLEAAYEATLWAAVLNARRGASNVVLLTRLGGGAFGNDDAWIDAAVRRALSMASDFGLDVRLVSIASPPPSMLVLEQEYRAVR